MDAHTASSESRHPVTPSYLDIHTHTAPNQDGNCLSVVNFHGAFDQVIQAGPCTIGLHPWYLDQYQSDLESLRQYAVLPNVLAIGECGLDRLCKTSWALQQDVFRRQLTLTRAIAKPLIIHCVRAFDELLRILDSDPPGVPVIFHGFNKRKAIAAKLLGLGYYLSFGPAILHDTSPAAGILAEVPQNRFFLETDDSALPIPEIYARAAQLRKTTEDVIILQVQENFNRLFPNL